jgi:hypothetical protein
MTSAFAGQNGNKSKTKVKKIPNEVPWPLSSIPHILLLQPYTLDHLLA